MKQRWDNVISTLKQRWNDIVQRWKTVVLILCMIDLTLLQCWTPTLYQYCGTLKIQFRILFYFQLGINLIWTVIWNVTICWNNVDPRLKLNVGRVVSMKKLILRNILPLKHSQYPFTRISFGCCFWEFV